MKAITLSAVALCLAAGSAAETKDPSSRLPGCYTRRATSMDLSDPRPTPLNGFDTLNIVPAKQPGLLSVRSQIMGANLNYCIVSGVFEFEQRVADVEFWRVAPDAAQVDPQSKYQTPSCELRLMVTRQALAFFKSEQEECSAYITCGVHASMSGVAFKRSTRKQGKLNACSGSS
jgi:hypothetical protein